MFRRHWRSVGERQRPPQGRPAVAGPGERSPDGLPPQALLDSRLLHPANVEPRAAAFRAAQQALGNRGLQRLIQAKLTVNPPDDAYEREADRVADAVMRMPVPLVQRQPGETLRRHPEVLPITPLLQRQEEEEEELQAKVQRQEEEEEELQAKVQRQEEEEEELQAKVQRQEEEEEELQAKAGSVPAVTPAVEQRIDALRGGGRPLPPSVRAFFEPRFGYDLGQVRIHTDGAAAETARLLQAQAFTVGHNIVLGSGKYAPESTSGKRLLAHELTHVVQQRQAGPLAYKTDSSVSRETVQRQAASGLYVHDEDARQTRPLPLEEYLKDYVDFNIESADYWLAPSSFARQDPKLREFRVNYKDGRHIRFSYDNIPARPKLSSTPGLRAARVSIPEFRFVKRGGFIYPRDSNYTDGTTPRLIDVSTTIKINQYRRERFKEIAALSAKFAIILTSYVAPGEGGAAAAAGRRAGGLGRPGRLPGPRQPGIGAAALRAGRLAALQRLVRRIFRRLGGGRTGYQLRFCDDATVIESRMSGTTMTGQTRIGVLTREAGGALTDRHARIIWVHEKAIRQGGISRNWGRLNLRQLVAHEIGHARTGSASCAKASRAAADLPTLNRSERIGLLKDAVHIAREEGVAVGNLNLPRGFVPPPPR